MDQKELIEKVDFITKRFQKTSENLENFSIQANKLFELLSKFQNQNENLSVKISALESEMKVVQSSSSKINACFDAFELKNLENIKEFRNFISETKSDFFEIKKGCAELKKEISTIFDLKNSIPSKDMINFISVNAKETKKKNEELDSKFTSHQVAIHQKAKELGDNCVNLKYNLKILSDEFLQHKDDVKQLYKILSIEKISTTQHFEELKNYVEKQIIQKILEIPKPVIPTQYPIEEYKKTLNSLLEPTLVDLKNFKTRSSDTENKISLLEKRFGHLQLVINKIIEKG